MVETSVCFSLFNVLSPVFGLAANVCSQVLSFRYAGLPLFKSIVLGFTLGFATLLVIQGGLYVLAPTASPQELPAMIVTNALIYGSLGYGYFHFLNLGETARRVRILWELYDARDGLAMEEILSRYNAKNMVALRLGRLLNNGQVSFAQGRYFIKSPLLLMSAKIMALLKLVIIGKKLGEE